MVHFMLGRAITVLLRTFNSPHPEGPRGIVKGPFRCCWITIIMLLHHHARDFFYRILTARDDSL